VFLYVFAKSESENIESDELEDLRLLARDWLQADAQRIAVALGGGALQEVRHDDEDGAQPVAPRRHERRHA